MANARGGLSKREYAAKQAGGTMNYKTGVVKVAAKKAPAKSTSSSYGASPIPGGGTYTVPGAKPTLTPQQQANVAAADAKFYASPDYASQASSFSTKQRETDGPSNKARSTSSTTFSQPTPVRQAINAVGSGIDSLRSGYDTATRKFTGTDDGQASPSLLGVGLSAGKKILRAGTNPIGRGISAFGELGLTEELGSLNNYLRPLKAEASDYPQDSPIEQALAPEGQGVDPSQEVVPEAQNSGIDWSKIATDPMGNPAAQDGGGGSTTDAFGVTSTGGSDGKKDKRGDDPYSQLAKMYDEDRKMKERAFAEMLDQVDPTYEGYKTEYNTALEKSRFNEKQQLLAQQMAYGTADSEQRAQAEERLALEFADKQGAFNKQLADRENASRAEIGLQRANALSSTNMKAADSYLDSYKYQKTLEQQDFENQIAQMKLRADAKSGNSKYDPYNSAPPTALVLQYMQEYGVRRDKAEEMVRDEYGYQRKPQTPNIFSVIGSQDERQY